MPNLPLASQSNTTCGSGPLGRAASPLSGSNPSTIGMAAERSTDRWQRARPQPEVMNAPLLLCYSWLVPVQTI